MPVLDGVEAARQIKALQVAHFSPPLGLPEAFSAGQASKPAYIVGTSASIESPAAWLAAGVNEMLPKPFTNSDVEKLLLAVSSTKSVDMRKSLVTPVLPKSPLRPVRTPVRCYSRDHM